MAGCPYILMGRLAACSAVVLTGCAKLPDIASGTCGNGVVEPPEDCDTFAPTPGSVCLPRGAIGECHLDCRRALDGSRRACPAGWGCDVQNICRRPTGNFESSPRIPVGGAFSLMTGDFDGDGRDDVVSLERPNFRGASRLTVHDFDATGTPTGARPFPKLVASPVIADLSNDGRSDLVFSSDLYGVGLVLGQADRSWVPETAGSYRFSAAGVRMLSVHDSDVQNSTPVIGLTTLAGTPGLYGPDQYGNLRLRGTVAGPVEALAGDPVSGNVSEDPQASPCDEGVFAFRDATSFSLVDMCTRDGATNEIVWRDEVTESIVDLDPPARIDAAPQLTDVDGDGHLDALLGAGGIAYVARGDGHGLGTAVPFRLSSVDPEQEGFTIPMPLAAGELTGDGVVDFVFTDHLLISVPASDGAGIRYLATHVNPGAPWTVARIADLNDNGKADVVAASTGRSGIDFFNGTGTSRLPAFELPTSGPVGQLAVTDLDGDLVDDLAFVEAGTSDGDRDSLMIAFGNLAGSPGTPTPVARISHIDQICRSHNAGANTLIVAYTETEPVSGAESAVLAFLMGSGDRLPFAPYALVDVARGSVFDEAAVALAVGRFSPATPAPRARDVLALGISGIAPDFHTAFWLLPGLGESPSGATRLGGALDPRLRPVYVSDLIIHVNVAGAAADLDRDGRDDGVWVIPADAGARCGLVLVSPTGTGAGGGLLVRDPLILDEPCPAPQIMPVDADGDGAVDLALLTGGPASPGRKLLVLWNDGTGGFSSANLATVSGPGDSPEQFTILPATPMRPLGFAYVTDQAAWLTSAVAASTPRVFAPPRSLADLQHGSGIVAADVNGDGVLDLAVAASGDLNILEAGLATP